MSVVDPRRYRPRRLRRVAVVVSLLLGAASCQSDLVWGVVQAPPAADAVIRVPEVAEPRVEPHRERDVAYGDLPWQMGTVIPASTLSSVGTIVYLPPGGFGSCDREALPDEMVLSQIDRGWGILVACGRLAEAASPGQVRPPLFPQPQLDAAAAVAWVRAEGGLHRLSSRRIVAVGYSAGGNLAALLGTAGNATAGPLAGRIPTIDGWVSISGVLEMNETHPMMRIWTRNLLGDGPGVPPWLASVSTYIDRDDPPGYLVHGDQDTWVPAAVTSHVVGFAAAARGQRIPYDVVDVDASGRSLGSCRDHAPFCGANRPSFDAFMADRAR